MLDGGQFAAFMERCEVGYTEVFDNLAGMMGDYGPLLTSWQGDASEEFRNTVSKECEDLIECLHRIAQSLKKTEDTALGIVSLKQRIGGMLYL